RAEQPLVIAPGISAHAALGAGLGGRSRRLHHAYLPELQNGGSLRIVTGGILRINDSSLLARWRPIGPTASKHRATEGTLCPSPPSHSPKPRHVHHLPGAGTGAASRSPPCSARSS